jgi:hypothetical protein
VCNERMLSRKTVTNSNFRTYVPQVLASISAGFPSFK